MKIETLSVLPVPVWQLSVPSCSASCVSWQHAIMADLQAQPELRTDIKQGWNWRRRGILQGRDVIFLFILMSCTVAIAEEKPQPLVGVGTGGL